MALHVDPIAESVDRRRAFPMLRLPDTFSIEFVRGMLSGVGYPARPCADWLADAGIEPTLIARPAARVTADQYVALFALLMDRLDDEFLGLLTRRVRRGSFALMVRSALSTATLGQALRRVRTTLRLLQDDIELVQVADGGMAGLRLVVETPGVAERAFLHELVLRVFWRLLVWLHGGRPKPTRFDFAFSAPAHAAEYAKVFPGSVRFDQPHSTVWFETAILEAPMSRDASAMREFLGRTPGAIVIPQRAEHSPSAQVRAHLQSSRPRWPDLAATAAALNLSVSTLQRHLATEGLGFQAVKDQLRLDVAVVRLTTSPIGLTALALELGFADSPSFQRAFKAWTGSPPGAYRRRADPPPSLNPDRSASGP